MTHGYQKQQIPIVVLCGPTSWVDIGAHATPDPKTLREDIDAFLIWLRSSFKRKAIPALATN